MDAVDPGAGAAGALDELDVEAPDELELFDPVVAPPVELLLFAAAVAALSIPPCPLQAPRPP